MVTIERPKPHTKTGLFVAWGVTLVATLGLAVVVVAAPSPHLAETSIESTLARQ